MKWPANEQPVIPHTPWYRPWVGHRQTAPQCLQRAPEPGCSISDEANKGFEAPLLFSPPGRPDRCFRLADAFALSRGPIPQVLGK